MIIASAMATEGIKGSIILVTGGSGSFGQAITKAYLRLSPKTIRIFSNDENAQVEMARAMKDERLRFLLGDVRDRGRLRRALSGVNIVIHCAALKHIDIGEYNPIEVAKTNVDGTVNVIETALDCGVDKALFISSDKAVHPTSAYGASKLLGEKIWIDSNVYGATKFSVVRMGNIWESRGNVIGLWAKQREKGEITITENDMERFYIHEDEATAFTLSCIDRMEGGEIFIPIMPSYTLERLASNIAPECKVRLIGRRRGEKKREELYSEDEKNHIERTHDCLIIRNT